MRRRRRRIHGRLRRAGWRPASAPLTLREPVGIRPGGRGGLDFCRVAAHRGGGDGERCPRRLQGPIDRRDAPLRCVMAACRTASEAAVEHQRDGQPLVVSSAGERRHLSVPEVPRAGLPDIPGDQCHIDLVAPSGRGKRSVRGLLLPSNGCKPDRRDGQRPVPGGSPRQLPRGSAIARKEPRSRPLRRA